MPSITYHQHHIVPKHDGGLYHPPGTNDPSNLKYLTLPEHTEAHWLLKEQTGCLKCKLAWLLMSGHTKAGESLRKELARSPDARAKNAASHMGRKHSPEARAKMRKPHPGQGSFLAPAPL